jgi:hypothetical protein
MNAFRSVRQFHFLWKQKRGELCQAALELLPRMQALEDGQIVTPK